MEMADPLKVVLFDLISRISSGDQLIPMILIKILLEPNFLGDNLITHKLSKTFRISN